MFSMDEFSVCILLFSLLVYLKGFFLLYFKILGFCRSWLFVSFLIMFHIIHGCLFLFIRFVCVCVSVFYVVFYTFV